MSRRGWGTLKMRAARSRSGSPCGTVLVEATRSRAYEGIGGAWRVSDMVGVTSTWAPAADHPPRPTQGWKMMPSCLTVLPMPAPSCPRRGSFQGAWACAAMVMVWVSVLLPTLRATAHATATALGTIVVGARTITDIDSSAQQQKAKRREGALQSVWSMADVQAADTTAH